MSIFLVSLAAAIAVGTALAAGGIGLKRRTGERGPLRLPGLAEPAAALPPVLLPERPIAADVGAVRFARAVRGYRRDQVHAVLERLAGALAERDALIEELHRRSDCRGAQR